MNLLKLLSIWARLSRNDRVRFVIVTVAYALTMRVTQSIPFKGSGLSPVWFPTGVALFFLVWWSPKLWPAVFIAGTMMNDYPFDPRDLFMGLVNALEPALAACIFLRIFRNRERLAELKGMATLLTLGALLTPMLGGVLVVAGEHWLHLPAEAPEATNWLLWMLGDLNGVLLITPVLLGFVLEDWATRWEPKRIVEAVITLALLVFVTGMVFDSWEKISPALDLGNEAIGQSFFILPVAGWIAFRFTGTFAGIALLSSMMAAMWQTVNGYGPYANEQGHRNILWLHAFMMVAGTCITLIVAMKRERDASNLELQESQAHYRYVFERNSQPMWLYDAVTLRFIDVNEAAIAKYGYSREEFLQMTIRDIRPPEDIPALMDDMAHPQDAPRQWRHICKDGRLLDVEVSATSVDRKDRSMRLVLANDITVRKALDAELQEAQKLERFDA